MKQNWIVLAPMRSGSKLIVEVIRNYYSIEKKLYYEYFDPNTNFDKIPFLANSQWIFHSHKHNDIQKYIASKAKVVLNDRDILESVLSRLIVDQTKEWHYYKYKRIEIAQLKLDLPLFKKYYHEHLHFRNSIARFKHLVNYVLEYNLFQNNPQIITKYLDLSIDHNLNLKYVLPMKRPGSYDQWFVNWHEVKDLILEYHNQFET